MPENKIRCVLNYLGFCCFILLQLGCAISYTDDNGKHHIVGFAHVEISTENRKSLIAGSSIEVSNVGALLSIYENQKHLSIGYVSEKTLYLKNNVLIGLPDISDKNLSKTNVNKEN